MADYDQSRLADYVDVPARIAEFRAKYPDGSLQPADLSHPYRIEQIGDQHYVVVVAAAYRSPEDPRPGVGMAYEQWPGRTPYTKNSELQNAETSAWGRAIVAALAADTKRIASAEDVRNRRADDEWDSAAVVRPPSDEQAVKFASLQAAIAAAGKDEFGPTWAAIVAAYKADEITEIQANSLRAALGKRKEEVAGDSTDDAQSGGAGTVQDGTGPSDDRGPAADGGPGRDGEAGGLRPGVQSSLHLGDGSGGATQAPGRDRGTRAAVGGRRE